MKLPPVDMAFLEELRLELGKRSKADALMGGIVAFRTLFDLSPYQAKRLRMDMQARGLNRVEYV